MKYIEEIMDLLAEKIYNKVEGNTFYFPVKKNRHTIFNSLPLNLGRNNRECGNVLFLENPKFIPPKLQRGLRVPCHVGDN